MLGYLVQLIVNFLFNVLIHKPKKRIKTPPGKVDSGQGEASVDALCRSTAEMLERRNLAGLMLDDFSFSQKLRKSDISSPALEDKLRAMALEVTGRLGLPPLKQVIVVRIDDVQQPDRFGEYDPGSRIIRFFIKKKYFPEQLEAALCHECAHYFMDLKGLADLSNMALNERRTDVIACLVGFSRIMIRGYMLLTKAHYRVVTWTTDSTRVGYLDAADCEQVRKYLLGIRPQLQSRQNAAADEAALRTQLTHNIAGAKAMLEQARAMKAAHGMPATGRMPAKTLAKVQQALLALENGELEARIRNCEAGIKGRPEQLRGVNQDIMAVCEQLSMLLAAFR